MHTGVGLEIKTAAPLISFALVGAVAWSGNLVRSGLLEVGSGARDSGDREDSKAAAGPGTQPEPECRRRKDQVVEKVHKSEVNTGRADNYVPIFNGKQRDYREFRKRCEIYKRKMELAGRGRETSYNIITMLQGKAWDLVEDLDITSLGEADGYDKMFARLDSGFKYDPMTELPDDFENFFVKLQRRPEQTLQEYSADFARAHRKLRSSHKVELPAGGSSGRAASRGNIVRWCSQPWAPRR